IVVVPTIGSSAVVEAQNFIQPVIPGLRTELKRGAVRGKSLLSDRLTWQPRLLRLKLKPFSSSSNSRPKILPMGAADDLISPPIRLMMSSVSLPSERL